MGQKHPRRAAWLSLDVLLRGSHGPVCGSSLVLLSPWIGDPPASRGSRQLPREARPRGVGRAAAPSLASSEGKRRRLQRCGVPQHPQPHRGWQQGGTEPLGGGPWGPAVWLKPLDPRGGGSLRPAGSRCLAMAGRGPARAVSRERQRREATLEATGRGNAGAGP